MCIYIYIYIYIEGPGLTGEPERRSPGFTSSREFPEVSGDLRRFL